MDSFFTAHGKVNEDGELTITNRAAMREALAKHKGRVHIVFYKAESAKTRNYYFGCVVKTLMEKFQLRKWEVHKDLMAIYNPEGKPLDSEIIDSICQSFAEQGIYIPEPNRDK